MFTFTLIYLLVFALVFIGYILLGNKKDREVQEALRRMSNEIMILEAKVEELEKTVDKQDFN